MSTSAHLYAPLPTFTHLDHSPTTVLPTSTPIKLRPEVQELHISSPLTTSTHLDHSPGFTNMQVQSQGSAAEAKPVNAPRQGPALP